MSLPDVPRYPVQGVEVSALTLDKAAALVVGAKGAAKPSYICLGTTHGVDIAQSDPEYRRILNESWLTTADGMPLVWLGPAGSSRVYGPDLMLAVCDTGRAADLGHYFYGGAPGVPDQLRQALEGRFPGLRVVGGFSPPYREATEEDAAFLEEETARLKPDIIWVGLGTPKQERFMAGPGMRAHAALLIGVGAAFDFHSGRKPQAPRWMQRSGLEWLFRLASEPGRLAGRYVRSNSLFILRQGAQAIGLRRNPS
jgi:N-acetylglucosaminyldiphosphoundecaprenol N-acetyl-beta-D-mannosaminyltransferase